MMYIKKKPKNNGKERYISFNEFVSEFDMATFRDLEAEAKESGFALHTTEHFDFEFVDEKVLKDESELRIIKTRIFDFIKARQEEGTFKNSSLEAVIQYICIGFKSCLNQKELNQVTKIFADEMAKKGSVDFGQHDIF